EGGVRKQVCGESNRTAEGHWAVLPGKTGMACPLVSFARSGGKCNDCYCSVKCGPRKAGPDDHPSTTAYLHLLSDEYTRSLGIRFCKERDALWFNKNGCASRHLRDRTTPN